MKFSQKQNKNVNDHFHIFNSENIQTVISFEKLLNDCKNINGDIIEFGVGRGRSLVVLSYLLSKIKSKKKLYAFDSFKGFGKIHINDKSKRNPKTGEWSVSPNQRYNYNTNFIKKILKLHLSPNYRYPVNFIEGYIENTLPNFTKTKKISFIHCDVDLYSPHKVILEYMWKKLSKKGIILFDDIEIGIKSKKFPGAVKAFKEFFKNKKITIRIDKFRNNILVIKN